jgi:hypothetical protein
MKSNSLFVATVLSTILLAVPALGQEEPIKADTARFGNPTSIARQYQNYEYGVIKSIDKHRMVLEKTKYGIDQTFKFDEKTKFIHDGKRSKRENLKVGDQVWVDTHKDKKTGDLIAKKVVTGIDVVSTP